MTKKTVRLGSLTALTGIAIGGGLVLANGLYHVMKPLPPGLSHSSSSRAEDVRFLRDLTWQPESGPRQVEQEIFDQILALIGNAERLILIDMFLFNDFLGSDSVAFRPLCAELTEALISRKQQIPRLEIIVITDPINSVYGGMQSPHLERLSEAGIQVILTDLDQLPDSNPLWSVLWRFFIKPFGTAPGNTVPNPFGGGRISLRSLLCMLNFKANHRKVVVADSSGKLVGIVTSANAHDGSSAHINVALAFSGGATQSLLETEEAVMRASGAPTDLVRAVAAEFAGKETRLRTNYPPPTDPLFPGLAVLTEGAIGDAVDRILLGGAAGTNIDLVMFYLADRRVVHGLKQAAERGATVRVILDPNKDAFGRVKNGMPNRQVARELVNAGIDVRWANTHGEQAHPKLLLVEYPDGAATMLLGSANFTRRNLRDLNPETSVQLFGTVETQCWLDARDFVNTLWGNRGGRPFTVDYETYCDHSRLRTIRYRLMEATGLCTW